MVSELMPSHQSHTLKGVSLLMADILNAYIKFEMNLIITFKCEAHTRNLNRCDSDETETKVDYSDPDYCLR